MFEKQAYDALFKAFLNEALGAPVPFELAPAMEFSRETEAVWAAQTAALMDGRQASINPLYAAKLTKALTRIESEVTVANLPDVASRRLLIADTTRFAVPENDFYYIKINHGYWEQVYWCFASRYDPARMREQNPNIYREIYVRSGFMGALAHRMRASMLTETDVACFPDIHFAVSLSNGDEPHAYILREFTTLDALPQKVLLGALTGLTGYMEAVLDVHCARFADGSFPKHGLATGALNDTLRDFAARAESILFVTPPHLRNVKLLGETAAQHNLYVSGERLHQGWAPALYAASLNIFSRLAETGSVMVITQSGVFSALLGLFLKHAKDKLFMHSARLYYFDLGQVLDIANPAGAWARKQAIKSSGLFGLCD